jgi:hypothetical protein
MRQILPIGAALRFMVYQERQRLIEPVRIREAERQEWLGVCSHGLPIGTTHPMHLRIGGQRDWRLVHSVNLR